jgi:hypothetical protein
VFSSITPDSCAHGRGRAKALGWLCLGLTSGGGRQLPPLFLLCERAEIVAVILAGSFAVRQSKTIRKRTEQISEGKQCQTKKSTPEIEVMTNAVWATPIHRRKQMKCFGEMSEHDYHETS